MLHSTLFVALALFHLSEIDAACPSSYKAPYDLSLSPLLTTPSITFTEGNGAYFIQPCGTVPDAQCPLTVAQTCFTKMSWTQISDDLGTSNNAIWAPAVADDWTQGAVSINNDISSDYDQCNAEQAYNAVVTTYTCDKGDDSVTVVKEPTIDKNGYCTFQFQVDSSIVCSIAKKKHGTSMSGGWIFVIILVVVFSVYFLGGMMFNRFKLGKSGAEMIPNVAFWRDLPSLVKDGFGYTLAKLKGLCGIKAVAGANSYDSI